MNLPGLGLLISLAAAREAGVTDSDVSRALSRGSGFLRWYVNKGAIPYGDHPAWPGHEDNGKCSAGAVLFDLLGDRDAAGFFAKMATAAYDERERGHTGNFYNVFWAMPGVSRLGPRASGAYWKEQGWYYDLARGWDGRFAYQGSPEGEEEHGCYTDWDCTGAYLLTFGLQRKSLLLTGRKPSVVAAATPAEVEAVIAAGRDCFAARKNGYPGRETSRLLQDLSSWSPIVRRRSALALARAGAEPVPALIRMLEAPDLNARYGACETLQEMKGAAAPAVPALQQALRHDDLWLRIRAAEALAAVGKAALPAVPDLLRRLAAPPSDLDPRGMEQRHLCGALFGGRGLLGRSLDGVDRESLYAAVRNGLRNEDGQARSSLGSVFRNLSAEEIKPLLPAVLQAVQVPAPSGEMFADGIRMEGLRILAVHRVEEGIEACVRYARDQNTWASEKRTPEVMKILQSYGARAKSVLPELRKLAGHFEGGEKNFPKNLSLRKAQSVRDTIQAVEASTDAPDLIRIGGGTPK
jgi:HEAT repeat protein